MIPTKVLMEEHQIILKGLDCLEKICQEVDKTGKVNKSAAERVLDFIRNFADKCHHGKEEDKLFVAMGEQGFPTQGGPIGCMLDEHQEGRQCVKAMLDSLEKASEGDKESLNLFVQNAEAFVELLRNHIHKEDYILFPMADQSLSSEEMEKLRRAFQKVEEEAGGKRHRQYIEVVRNLCEEYRISFVEPREYQTLLEEYSL